MKTKNNLQLKSEMRSLPFYSSSFWDKIGNPIQKNFDDFSKYKELENKISEEAKKLKKGTKVLIEVSKLISPKKGEEYIEYTYLEGIINKPFHIKKRSRYGEAEEHEIITVSCGGYLYPCNPKEVIAI